MLDCKARNHSSLQVLHLEKQVLCPPIFPTAEYGPDAYDFVKDKPLTLVSGGELLFLLEKHGHKARIDLAEAREINAEHRS